MVTQPSPRSMSVEEWRALERANPDTKYEYIDGNVYMMSGGSFNHARIAQNMVAELNNFFGDGPCSAYNSDVRVRLSEERYTLPDMSVTCSEHDQGTGDEVETPLLIAEVLSDSTEARDRGRKFGYYRACPTIQEYVLIATRYQTVEVYRRTSEGWTSYRVYGPGEEVELESLDVRIPLATLYRRTTVCEGLDDVEGDL
ncbi:MAG TPA: hypothetical protein DHW02_13840 [Ktedonobacter sp.]|nr:hypothetical protein [Ktedonobacter sp.]